MSQLKALNEESVAEQLTIDYFPSEDRADGIPSDTPAPAPAPAPAGGKEDAPLLAEAAEATAIGAWLTGTPEGAPV